MTHETTASTVVHSLEMMQERKKLKLVSRLFCWFYSQKGMQTNYFTFFFNEGEIVCACALVQERKKGLETNPTD